MVLGEMDLFAAWMSNDKPLKDCCFRLAKTVHMHARMCIYFQEWE